MKEKKKRYYILDIIRAITLISMVLYHFTYDLLDLFGQIKMLDNIFLVLWQQSICITFVFLSGFCFSLGKHPLRRGLIIFGCGCVVSLFTYFFMKNMFISFGILSFMGLAMLITTPLNLLFKKIKFNHWVGFFVFLTLFVLIKNIWRGSIIFGAVEMPEVLYQNVVTAYLGFPPKGFFSADYFPILPWICLYLSGYFAYQIAQRLDLLKYLTKFRIKPLEFIGRHTLIIYMAHQPIIYGISYLIYYLANIGKL